MNEDLSQAFAEQGMQRLLEQIRTPKIISGATEFYSHQAEIFSDTRDGASVFEWQLQGKPTVLIINGAHGKKLAEMAGVPFVSKHFQYPTKEFDRVRAGQEVLGMEKAASGIPTAMIQKDLALTLLDPWHRRHAEMEKIITKLEDLMDKQGMTGEEILQYLERLEESMASEPATTRPVNP